MFSERIENKSVSLNILPIHDVLPDLLRELQIKSRLVLVAPPGAGKTTCLPLALKNEEWLHGQKILILEPRRLAARAAAERMAHLLGEKVGDTVGLRMRLETRISSKTRIEVLTEGIFTRMLLDNPFLEGVGAVLFDEFHERSLDADFGLALTLDTQQALRPDLRLVVMSATLDGGRVSTLLDNAAFIRSEGRSYPITTHYLGRHPTLPIEEQVVTAIFHALSEELGSILVFLPGQREITKVQSLLENRIKSDLISIYPLYGALSSEIQQKAIAPSLTGKRKIVLTTSIAETSLTIEGIRIVIDSGLARIPHYEPDKGLTQLKTIKVSRAAADQRQGRAGRMEAGICYRLWEEAAHNSLEEFAPPEIFSSDLSTLLLNSAYWGEKYPENLKFLDPPPRPALMEARKLLKDLDALAEDGSITETGRLLRSFPLPIRLSCMILKASSKGLANEAALLAALLTERGIGGASLDLSERMERFLKDTSPKTKALKAQSQNWIKEAKLKKTAGTELSHHPEDLWGFLLAFAYPDRIARQRGKAGEYLMANGRAASLEPHLPLAEESFIVIAELGGKAAHSHILAAAALSESSLLSVLEGHITERTIVSFDRESRSLKARSTLQAGRLNLKEHPVPVSLNEESSQILTQGLQSLGLSVLPWSKTSLQWKQRVQFLYRAQQENWPDLSDDILLNTFPEWLSPYLHGKTSLSQLGPHEFMGALEQHLTWEQKQILEQEAPMYFIAPTGSHIPIDYSGEEPVLAIRVQELFGLSEHPSLSGRKVPLVLHLLSPAHRPIQITKDLVSFWKGSWASVKADMKGQYPKHPWPDDPLQAEATYRAKPRKR